jgi:UDPglucose 6-dehydrogenase
VGRFVPADILDRVRQACDGTIRGARVGLLGLAFKAGTNDLRDSPAVRIADLLVAEGAEVTAHDPAISGELPGIRLMDGFTVLDTRNLLDGDRLTRAGLTWRGTGRPVSS